MRRHGPPTQAIRIEDREAVRPFLEGDPVGNAVVWDRVFQHADYKEIYADGNPPKAVLAMARAMFPEGPTGFALHALEPAAAKTVLEAVPVGPAFFFLTEEWPIALLEPRAQELQPRSAWLFGLNPEDFVDLQAHEVQPVTVEWAGRIAKLWEPDWPSELYVRSRIEKGSSCGIYEDDQLVAWAMTHFETDRVSMMGFLHVLEEYRRKGYAKSVGSALIKDILGRGKIPALHIYVDNAASLELAEELGFHRVKRQVWADAVLR